MPTCLLGKVIDLLCADLEDPFCRGACIVAQVLHEKLSEIENASLKANSLAFNHHDTRLPSYAEGKDESQSVRYGEEGDNSAMWQLIGAHQLHRL